VTSLPDWLVERAALDEVPAASRDRVERADPGELASRVAAVRDDDAAEIARHPVAPAVAQIEARIAAESRQRTQRRRRRARWLGLATSAAATIVIARLAIEGSAPPPDPDDQTQGVRAKGAPHLLAFRHAGDTIERLAEDAVVRAGDVIQLRYHAGGQRYGVIASLDGAGLVTLHFPEREDAPPDATAIAPKPTALPDAYALDAAPRFERFFFITANSPLDVSRTLAAVRALAPRDDSATAPLALPPGLRQWSLRLRKADHPAFHQESP